MSAEQVADVLAPLFVARIQPPAMPKTYRLIADAWSYSPVGSTQETPAVLDEGKQLF